MRAAKPLRLLTLVWVILGGALLGALSWLLPWFISGHFEPYDSGLGMLLNQLLLALPALAIVWFFFMRIGLLFLMCAYVGLNLATYVLGDSEARAWIGLGAVVSLILFIVPVVLTLILALLRSNWLGRIVRKRFD